MPSLQTESRAPLVASSVWQLVIDEAGHPGSYNMAVDQALLDAAHLSGSATLRLYRWDPPCLSFGRNESADQRYDRALIERLGLDAVRRPTGGRAVWHEHEVTYAVAAPLAEFGSLRAAYHAIHARLAAALRSLGADATLAPDRVPARPDGPGSCFDAPVGGEVLVSGRKVVGSAQVRLGDAFLQHGSILLDGSQEALQRVALRPLAPGGATTLSAALGRSVMFKEVVDAIIGAWGEDWALTASYRRLPPLPARFLDPGWTWRR
jgi:lipoate-protein ligase A